MSLVRQHLGVNQKVFAEKLEISGASLSDIERGKNGLSLSTFAKLVLECGVNPYWLLTGDGEMLSHYPRPPDVVDEKSELRLRLEKAEAEIAKIRAALDS